MSEKSKYFSISFLHIVCILSFVLHVHVMVTCSYMFIVLL